MRKSKRQDPDKSEFTPIGPNPLADPMVTATVARGRCLHVPVPGRTKIVGTRPVDKGDGTVIWRDVTAAEVKIHNQGETVTLPESECRRLQELGFLVADAKPVKANGKVKPETGVPNDPRVS
jgi:hypothetical protein